MECEKEWSNNKKLVDLSAKDIRRAIPKGFSYFSVDFGLQSGFAHVIEDEKMFPSYFGKVRNTYRYTRNIRIYHYNQSAGFYPDLK